MKNNRNICCENSMPIECADGIICISCGHKENKN